MLQLSTKQGMEIDCTEMGEVLQRGRMYERYREKREAKLREEWFLRMEEKEAEMRAMWDRFERARTPSSSQSDLHTGKQKMTKSILGDEKTKAMLSRNNRMKINSLGRSSFSMPLTTKENRAPGSKDVFNIPSSVSTPRSLSRSRSITKEKKEGVLVKSHHRRNTLAGPIEFRDLELDKNFYPGISSPRKSHSSKLFLRKGSGIGPGAGAAIAKQRNSIGTEQKDAYSSFVSGDSSSSRDSIPEFLVTVSSSSTSSESESFDYCSNKDVRDANFVRERKKWGAPQSPLMFSSESQKDETRGLKKLLLNIVRKKGKGNSISDLR